MKEFSGLDAKTFDKRPLQERKRLHDSFLNADNLLDVSTISHEDGEIDKGLLAVERYTYASVIIEDMWKSAKESGALGHDESIEPIALNEDFWKNFTELCIATLEKVRNDYYAGVEHVLKNESENLAFSDLATMRHMYLAKLETGQLGRVSFDDLVVIYTRLARVVERLGGEDHITQVHYEQALSHPTFRNMMLEMMTNSREAGLYMSLFIDKGGKIVDLEDTSGSFDEQHFIVAGDVETGDFHITPNPETVGKAKNHIMELFRKKQAEGTAPAVFRCPVIYTGLFQEMCDWMRHEFTHHYLDQRFGGKG